MFWQHCGHILRVTCAHTISQMICSCGISNRNGKITEITRISTNCKWLQVPFSFSKYRSLAYILMSRYLLFKFALPFSLARTYKRLVQPYGGFPRLCRYSKTFLRTFYLCAHSVDASSTRCRLNKRKLNTYRETRPPSWANGTWQVPSQLSHSAMC